MSCILLASACAACSSKDEESTKNEPPPTRAELFPAIDPRIGTGGLGFGVGSTYPGPAVPFAMIHPSPDTRSAPDKVPPGFSHCAGYAAGDGYIAAFSLVHFEGTGVPDYGALGIMPTSGMSDAKRTAEGHAQAFDKAKEQTLPGYYSVELTDGIRVEITSSLRAATFRYTFPSGSSPVVLFDLDHRLEGEILAADIAFDAATVSAHVEHHGPMSGGAGGYDLFAEGVFDVTPSAMGTFDGTALHAGQTTATGVPLGGWVEFPAGTSTVTLRLAVSFVDPEGAEKNLAAEAPSFDFDGMRAKAEAEWKTAVDRIELWGASEYDTTVMATAIYHVLAMPTLMSDTDGRFVNALGEITQGSRPRYNDFSLWDTYRTLHPWLLLTEDVHNEDFAASLVDMAAEGGAVPVWGIAHGDSKTMIGSPGEIVLAESALKGIHFDDEDAAYQLARVAAYGPSPGPIGGRDADIADYLAKGYVPSDVTFGSVSKTQEYAVADAALANWAKKLGISADADELGARGKNYENHWDPEVGYFRGKESDGSWAPFGSPTAMNDDYTEGNAGHYLWMVPHDPDGLGETLGGREAALDRLREFFAASHDEEPILGTRSYYWPSNEPDINAPWLFAAWGAPNESWNEIDWIVTELYGTGVDGIPGNDDGGTMSAWLLFAAAGLYPISGTDEYIVAAPRYAKVVLHRTSGDLTFEATPSPRPGLSPKQVTLDGVPIENNRVSHAALVGTHVIHFSMGK
jgi:predicted alpha-1,2-mannosidase